MPPPAAPPLRRPRLLQRPCGVRGWPGGGRGGGGGSRGVRQCGARCLHRSPHQTRAVTSPGGAFQEHTRHTQLTCSSASCPSASCHSFLWRASCSEAMASSAASRRAATCSGGGGMRQVLLSPGCQTWQPCSGRQAHPSWAAPLPAGMPGGQTPGGCSAAAASAAPPPGAAGPRFRSAAAAPCC